MVGNMIKVTLLYDYLHLWRAALNSLLFQFLNSRNSLTKNI